MGNQTASFYNTFSMFYPLVDGFLLPQKDVLFKEINLLPEGNLLDVGVGNGAHFPRYKRHKITGIDTSMAMLAKAGKYASENIKLLQMDANDLSFKDGLFDYAVLSHVIAVVDNPEQVLDEARRVLKPRGKLFILNHFTPDNWLRHIDSAFSVVAKVFHFRSLFYIDELKSVRGFRLLKEVRLGSFSYFRLLIYEKK